MLDTYRKDKFKVVAALRSGHIAFDCKKCEDAPYIKENLGCEKALQEAATWWPDEEEEWYVCPIRYIMSSCGRKILDFIREYDSLIEKWAQPLKYSEYSSKFLEAKSFFESCYQEYKVLRQGK